MARRSDVHSLQRSLRHATESLSQSRLGDLALLFLPVAECFELRDAMEHLRRPTKAAVKNNWKNARNLITRCTQFERLAFVSD